MRHAGLRFPAFVVAVIPWAGIAAASLWGWRRWRVRCSIVTEETLRAEPSQEGDIA